MPVDIDEIMIFKARGMTTKKKPQSQTAKQAQPTYKPEFHEEAKSPEEKELEIAK